MREWLILRVFCDACDGLGKTIDVGLGSPASPAPFGAGTLGALGAADEPRTLSAESKDADKLKFVTHNDELTNFFIFCFHYQDERSPIMATERQMPKERRRDVTKRILEIRGHRMQRRQE